MPLPVGTLMPSFDGATSWFNLEAMPEDLFCQPVIVYFWAMSCPSCKANMPGLHELRDTYRGRGLRLVGVHMPRGEFDLDAEKAQRVAEELGVSEACAIDNDHTIGDRFEVGGLWPTYFLFDEQGRLKRRAAGGFGLKVCEAAVREMFAPVDSVAVAEAT